MFGVTDIMGGGAGYGPRVETRVRDSNVTNIVMEGRKAKRPMTTELKETT